jgi:hypothetical protein
MSLTPAALEEFCLSILQFPRIDGKIVILCEGERNKIGGTRLSPQSYSEMARMPDRSFYEACVPRWWSQQRPKFINCGDRVDVINTYFQLRQLGQASPRNYLDPSKLFAIVDLDINHAKLDPQYPFTDTETVFQDLYHQGSVKQSQTAQHSIWVTGFIHKEAYFIAPEVETTLKQHFNPPFYKGKPLLLRDLYFDMADAAVQEADLIQNFAKVTHRVSHCQTLDCTDLACLIESWKVSFQTAQTDEVRNQLVKALLTLKKTKDKDPEQNFWGKIQPPADWTGTSGQFREQLSKAIAREFYAQQPADSHLHLPTFFNALYQRI